MPGSAMIRKAPEKAPAWPDLRSSTAQSLHLLLGAGVSQTGFLFTRSASAQRVQQVPQPVTQTENVPSLAIIRGYRGSQRVRAGHDTRLLLP